MNPRSRTSVAGRPGQQARADRQAKTGQYLYAVVRAAQARTTYGPIGIYGGKVYAVSSGPLAAVVSDVPRVKMRPERRHLAAHHQVLNRLTDQGTILPISFGVIARAPNAIRRILHTNQAAFLDQLHRVEGKVEMGIRVVWDVPNIFEYMVAQHQELRALRDYLFRPGRGPSHTQKIELGRLFESLLNGDRATHTDTVVDALQARCVEIRPSAPRHEHEVMNLACLVRRNALDRFEDAVLEAARVFDNNYSFDFTGPWPPFNFVEAVVEV